MEFNATFLVTIISFIVFVYLMNKILYLPIQKVVTEREDFVDSNLSAAESNNIKAKELSDNREQKILTARNDARNVYIKSLNGYKKQKDEFIHNAQEEVKNELNQAFEGLEKLSNETKEGLKGKMTDLANDIVEKMLGYRSEVPYFDNEKVDRILYH